MPRRKVDVAAVVFALLVVASVGAFAYAQRVKRDPLLVDRVGIGTKESNVFTPPCERIKLKFRTTTSNDAMVEVIRPGGEIVSKLARHTFLKRYSFHTFYWDGTNEDGVAQPPAVTSCGSSSKTKDAASPPPARSASTRCRRATIA
jgi:hypothetical protein